VARGGRGGGGLNNLNNQFNPDDQPAAQGQVPQLARGNELRPPTPADAERDLQDLADQLINTDTTAGPLTGTGFRDWSDRLRNIEEMVTDPRLRAEAARIRERATAIRAEYNRHSAPPNWDIVQETIGKPLAELRDAIALELLKKDSATALVPIDREPVPPEYAEQVRKYYERLGSGK
jgi:hypothetical protein